MILAAGVVRYDGVHWAKVISSHLTISPQRTISSHGVHWAKVAEEIGNGRTADSCRLALREGRAAITPRRALFCIGNPCG
jgi:hypothetical protein